MLLLEEFDCDYLVLNFLFVRYGTVSFKNMLYMSTKSLISFFGGVGIIESLNPVWCEQHTLDAEPRVSLRLVAVLN